MTEGEIRMQAQLFALQAEMYTKVAQIEGMKAENQFSEYLGNGINYGEDSFAIVQEELKTIADRMRNEI